jgi:hypothetical protein
MQRPPFKTDSYSSDFLAGRNGIPQVSALMANNVSQFRKDMLANEVAQGIYREGNGPSFNDTGLTKNAVALGTSTKKFANMGGGGYGAYGGHADALKQAPEIYSPLWLTSNLNLPRDRATINAWCRAFFALNPFVHNAIQLHSTYPISKLNIKCPDKKIEKFFNDMIEELDLMNICVQIAQEYWLLGEAFVQTEYDANRGQWSRVFLQNPDYMVVQPNVVANEPIIMIRPDEHLKNIVKSNKPSDIEQRKQLPQYIVDAVKRGQNILLDNFMMSHLARKISPYEIRGTGLPVCIFRALCLYDKLYESKFAQSEDMVNPLTLIKIGGNGPDALHPTHADLESMRQQFEALSGDKNAKLFTHPDVTIERVGAGSGIYDISGDLDRLTKTILTGLQVPQVLMDGGADTTYANGSVALDVLKQRYMQFRNTLSIMLRRKIFAPIAKIQGFWENKDGQKQLIVPDIDWNHMALFDTNDYIANLITLSTPTDPQKPGTVRVSMATLHRSLGLETVDENRKIRKEAIERAILEKEEESLKVMTLTELKALDEDSEIPEPPAQAAAPGENPVPGEMPTGDLSGLPGLGGPSPEAPVAPPIK